MAIIQEERRKEIIVWGYLYFNEVYRMHRVPIKNRFVRSKHCVSIHLEGKHMMRFTAFPEIRLNPGMRDIGDCRWAKSTHRAHISVWVPRNTHPQSLDISPVPPKPSIALVPGFNRVSRKAVKHI